MGINSVRHTFDANTKSKQKDTLSIHFIIDFCRVCVLSHYCTTFVFVYFPIFLSSFLFSSHFQRLSIHLCHSLKSKSMVNHKPQPNWNPSYTRTHMHTQHSLMASTATQIIIGEYFVFSHKVSIVQTFFSAKLPS